jgi:hypothetical protein
MPSLMNFFTNYEAPYYVIFSSSCAPLPTICHVWAYIFKCVHLKGLKKHSAIGSGTHIR